MSAVFCSMQGRDRDVRLHSDRAPGAAPILGLGASTPVDLSPDGRSVRGDGLIGRVHRGAIACISSMGILVAKMTKKPPHVISCEKAHGALQRTVGAGWRVMAEAPVRLSEHSEPEPDIALARGGADDYSERHPGPADVPLIVEVADSSLPQGPATGSGLWRGRRVGLLDRQPRGPLCRGLHRPAAGRLRRLHRVSSGSIRPGRARWRGGRPDPRR